MIGLQREFVSGTLALMFIGWAPWSSGIALAQTQPEPKTHELTSLEALWPTLANPIESGPARSENPRQNTLSEKALFVGPCVGVLDLSCFLVGGKIGFAGSHYGAELTVSLAISTEVLVYSHGKHAERARFFVGAGAGLWFWEQPALLGSGGVELKSKYIALRAKLSISIGDEITWDAGTLVNPIQPGLSLALYLRLPFKRPEPGPITPLQLSDF